MITGSRAEYGHLRWLARDIADDPRLELRMVVTGTHFSPRFGETWREIVADGFNIDARVIPHIGDTPQDAAVSMGVITQGVAQALTQLQPHMAVILGDRYEMLAAAAACLICKIPLAHLHGGEITEGAFDDSIRHAITKMAHLHFAAAGPYGQRIVQMGEDPNRVFVVGAPGLDILTRATLPDRAKLGTYLRMPLERPLFLVTYHPVTLSQADPAAAVTELLWALDQFPDAQVVITGVNADPGHSRISETFHRWADQHPQRVRLVESMGSLRYFGCMRLASAVIGNSSSGVIEAPALGVPTVNMGDRQRGRLRAPSIIDCPEQRDAITQAITLAQTPDFVDRARSQSACLEQGGTSARIREILANADLTDILVKKFHDAEGAPCRVS